MTKIFPREVFESDRSRIMFAIFGWLEQDQILFGLGEQDYIPITTPQIDRGVANAIWI